MRLALAVVLFSGSASAQAEEPAQAPAPSQELEQAPEPAPPPLEAPAPARAPPPAPVDEPAESTPPGYADRFIDRPLVLPPGLKQVDVWAPSGVWFARSGNAAFYATLGGSVGLLDRWDVSLFAGAVMYGSTYLRFNVSPATSVAVVRSDRVQLALQLMVPVWFDYAVTTVVDVPPGGSRVETTQHVAVSTTAGVVIGLDTRFRLTDALALRLGESLFSVTPPPAGSIAWRFVARLAPALEIQLGKFAALIARVRVVQIDYVTGVTRPLSVGYGLEPSLVFSFGWHADLIVDLGLTNTTLGSLTVYGGLAGRWRF